MRNEHCRNCEIPLGMSNPPSYTCWATCECHSPLQEKEVSLEDIDKAAALLPKLNEDKGVEGKKYCPHAGGYLEPYVTCKTCEPDSTPDIEGKLDDILLDFCGEDCAKTHTHGDNKILRGVIKDRLLELFTSYGAKEYERGKNDLLTVWYEEADGNYEKGQRAERTRILGIVEGMKDTPWGDYPIAALRKAERDLILDSIINAIKKEV